MKYKENDRVRIKSIHWYNENKDADSCVHCGDRVFDNYMSVFCGSVVTIGGVSLYGYDIREDLHCRTWTDEMFEELVEEETSIDLTVKGEDVKKRIEIAIPEGYEYLIESGKIIFTKKKKEYPKTFEECVSVLMREGGNRMSLELMNTFRKLIDARNAYWTIYGKENGLEKPWEPDWNIRGYYAIARSYGNVVKTSNYNCDLTFVFPTEEMRDAFYENFKSKIESCKELL